MKTSHYIPIFVVKNGNKKLCKRTFSIKPDENFGNFLQRIFSLRKYDTIASYTPFYIKATSDKYKIAFSDEYPINNDTNEIGALMINSQRQWIKRDSLIKDIECIMTIKTLEI